MIPTLPCLSSHLQEIQYATCATVPTRDLDEVLKHLPGVLITRTGSNCAHTTMRARRLDTHLVEVLKHLPGVLIGRTGYCTYLVEVLEPARGTHWSDGLLYLPG